MVIASDIHGLLAEFEDPEALTEAGVSYLRASRRILEQVGEVVPFCGTVWRLC